MANTTFNGPVVSLNGFIGGPNPNAGGTGANDTEQGGKRPFSVTNATTLTITSGTESGTKLLATANEGAMVYTLDLSIFVSGKSATGTCCVFLYVAS